MSDAPTFLPAQDLFAPVGGFPPSVYWPGRGLLLTCGKSGGFSFYSGHLFWRLCLGRVAFTWWRIDPEPLLMAGMNSLADAIEIEQAWEARR